MEQNPHASTAPGLQTLMERLGVAAQYTRTGLDGSLHFTTTPDDLTRIAEDAGVGVSLYNGQLRAQRGLAGRLAIFTAELPS